MDATHVTHTESPVNCVGSKTQAIEHEETNPTAELARKRCRVDVQLHMAAYRAAFEVYKQELIERIEGQLAEHVAPLERWAAGGPLPPVVLRHAELLRQDPERAKQFVENQALGLGGRFGGFDEPARRAYAWIIGCEPLMDFDEAIDLLIDEVGDESNSLRVAERAQEAAYAAANQILKELPASDRI